MFVQFAQLWNRLSSHCLSRVLGTLALCALAACGGGGGDPGDTRPPTAPGPTPIPDPANQQLALTQVVNVPDAVYVIAPPGDARLFVVERRGRILIVDNGALRSTPFLDITDRACPAGEGGLLSMAFDPGFATNGYFYILYTDAARRITLERLSVGSNPNQADATSALPLLSIPHAEFNHHFGGLLSFGPDGFLYLSTGDGGGVGDPLGNSQNPNSLLGKLLRLDVNGATAAAPYRIPSGNPYVGQTGKRPEIWASGLRNPWRYAFDASLLYIADVGQDQWEEVNIVNPSLPGLNFGWNTMEGNVCYGNATCATAGLTLPVFQYDHTPANGCSITGGEVYRGRRIPALVGSYFFSDYCAGYLKSLRYTGTGTPTVVTWPVAKVGGIVSFGRDGEGELYLISATGGIYRIGPAAAPSS
ncbi:MAG: PQQ-dependent sugar dehydrogenase [Gammaproteobacteria bacterium]